MLLVSMGNMVMRVRPRAEEMEMEKGDRLESSKRSFQKYLVTKARVE